MPPGWVPREQEIAKALDLGVSVEREAERFRNHHAAKGSVFADWDAAFRNWVDNACKFAAKSRNGTNVTVGRIEPSRPDEYPEGDVLL